MTEVHVTDLRKLSAERVEGIRTEWLILMSELPEDSAGAAVLIESGDLAYVILASADDDGRVLDIEVRSFDREVEVGARAFTLRRE